MYRKMMTLLLACTFVFVTACGSGGDKEEAVETAAPIELKDGKYDPPVQMSYLRSWNDDTRFRNGETPQDNVHTKWAKERLGIELTTPWTAAHTNDAFYTKLRLSLSANEELPDVVVIRGDYNLVRELIESGKFADAGALFDQYASKTWKEAADSAPTEWYPYMFEGKRMGIPVYDYAYNSDPVLFIREDWLKKLNLKEPTNIDELEKVMDAFTNQDPDGNGKKDTYGMTAGWKNNFNTWMSETGWVFGMFDTMPGQWNKAADNTLEYGSIQPGIKEGLGTLKDWLDKGYLPKEAGVYDETKAAELFTAGKAGMIVGPHWMPNWPIDDVKKNVKGASYKAIALPKGPTGESHHHGSGASNGVILINKDMKNPEIFFTYQNYLFDNFANPAVGSEFENGFAKGYDYDIVDGKVLGEAEVKDGVAPVKYTLTYDGARIPDLLMETLSKLASGQEPKTPFEKNIKISNKPEVFPAAQVVVDHKGDAIKNEFTGAPTDTMKMKKDALDKMEKDTFSKIVYGQLPLDEFDKFVEKWTSMGGEQITTEVNEWYKSVQN
ncbi:extracellular solute-binding protein [Paenibacillus sp. JX-17]|uniref:Extracellular solute-binding protein n=1 Tax=Paenibacillus lacisoli TaxID=3064525 RepID=A0ABT9CF52_9BACL|nr:extracellular solute-binding protein [Paenibacillus sp. JX-17]MDO7907904.1 extracellular solute-binding protein [Paenibacillus sp. JX-17]